MVGGLDAERRGAAITIKPNEANQWQAGAKISEKKSRHNVVERLYEAT